MRLANRNDLFLLGGLAASVFVMFSRRIGEAIDFIYQVDRSSGLQLLPALTILTGVFIFHLLRRRTEMNAANRAAHARAQEMERLVAFGQALASSLDIDAIRATVREHLPNLVARPGLWLSSRPLGLRDPEDGAGNAQRYPLVVGGTAMGVIGVPPGEPLSEQERGVIVAAAAMLAVTIKNAELFREVHESSVKDPLTGCFRRRHALEIMDVELRRARRSSLPLAVLMFDLDHFKSINDHHGHLAGDAVLSAVGNRMNAVLRASDVKCRYGGEEFLVILPETAENGARHVADTLRRDFEEHPVLWNGEIICVTASFGVTTVIPGEDDTTAIIARADAALYRAKQEGRNRVSIHEHAGVLAG